MKLQTTAAAAVLIAAAVSPLRAQTQVHLPSQTRSVDFSNAPSTKPSKTGTLLPPVCSVGETFLKIDATPGQNLYACTAPNVWSVQGGLPEYEFTGYGKILTNDDSGMQWESLDGDVTGAPDSLTVNKLQGRAVSSSAPASGHVLSWDGLQWAPSNLRAKTGLPVSPQTGDLALDSADANRAKVFDGTAWVGMTAVPNYFTVFISASTVTVLGTAHKLGTANLVVECYDNDTPSNRVEPDSVRVNPSTYDVTVTFAVPQTGRLVIGAAGAGGSSGAEASAALDFPNIAASSCAPEQTFSLPGAAPGDEIAPGWPNGLEAGLIGMMRVPLADTIAVRLCNLSGSALNPANATFRARAVKYF
jgi:hypothetical protein